MKEIDVLKNTSSLRRRVYMHLEPTAWPYGDLSLTNRLLCVLILLSVLVAVLETERVVAEGYENFFAISERLFAAIFLVEYVARVWTSSEDPRYGGTLLGKLRYICSPVAVVDLVALAPILLSVMGSEGFLLRILRFLRIIRVARLGRFSRAMAYIGVAVRSRGHELVLSVCGAGLLLLVSSTLLYLAEGHDQPEGFGSIPRAMWWSVATLTTVGYGDVYPITALGRVFAAVTAVTGIGLIAMPTGILAAAFSDAMRRHKPNSSGHNE